VGVITASEPSWVVPYSGLSPKQFGKLITVLRRGGSHLVCRGRPWSLPLEDRVLLVAAYWRTNLTLRQLSPLFGISQSAAGRIVSQLGLLARTAAAQSLQQRHRADRGRHPGADPGPQRGGAVQELPLLDQPPGRHQR
jgi:hypothetical protein